MKHIILSTVFALALTACTTNEALRRNEPGKPLNSIANTGDKNHKLAFVEFGEQGSFQDTTQLGEARRLLENTSGKVLLVMYLHGWHNDANSKDVGLFEDFLEGISQFQLVEK